MVNLTQNPQYNYTVLYYYLNYSSGLCRQRYIRFAQLHLWSPSCLNLHGQILWSKPEPDSGPGPDLPAVWISPQTHQKYTVVYSELIRSLLATSYASLAIIGASDVRGRCRSDIYASYMSPNLWRYHKKSKRRRNTSRSQTNGAVINRLEEHRNTSAGETISTGSDDRITSAGGTPEHICWKLSIRNRRPSG